MPEVTYPGVYRTKPRRVFFTGSTALVRGQGVCYDRDNGTATARDGSRDTRVELPTTSNHRDFAGVCAGDYSAASAGQWIEIHEPGSVCEIALLASSTTINTTRLSCCAGSGAGGYFVGGTGITGHQGRGMAIALQSASSAAENPSVISQSLDGSATYTTATRTITKTGAFTNIPATASLVGNEYIHVVGGVTTNSAAKLTVGRYKITSKTSNDAVVIETDIGSGTNGNVAFFCTRGNPTILAYLLPEGPSGFVEFVSTVANGASQSMVGGHSVIVGGVTVATGNTTSTLADGTMQGERKSFFLTGALTTNGYALTITTGSAPNPAGTGFNAWQTLTSATMATSGANIALEWQGTRWLAVLASNVTLA